MKVLKIQNKLTRNLALEDISVDHKSFCVLSLQEAFLLDLTYF